MKKTFAHNIRAETARQSLPSLGLDWECTHLDSLPILKCPKNEFANVVQPRLKKGVSVEGWDQISLWHVWE